jgi:hypothetical protein
MKVGSYTFKVTNKGQFAHNLTIDGPGVKDKATPRCRRAAQAM